MGRLLPPVDINNANSLSELDKRISIGPITLVLVYADWCGHCQRFKPNMEKLENLSGRSIQTARIRDDMLPQSSLKNTKINGYPSLLLIDKSGQPTTFKDKNGEVTNTIPEYNDLNKMMTIVRNAGTPNGISLLNKNEEPTTLQNTNIVTDRLSNQNVTNLNRTLMNSNSKSLQNSTSSISGGGMNGGGLWGHLLAASQKLAPATALLLGASVLNKKRKGLRKTKKNRR